MKKVVVCIAVLMFFLMMPFVLFAKTSISESEMGTITAQEGITLNFGAYPGTVAATNFAPSIVSWGDSNGFGATYTSAGYVGVSGVTMGATSSINLYNAMTIDVGTNAGVTKLNVGLPTVLIHPLTTDATVALSASQNLSSPQVLGTFYNDQFALIVNLTGAGSMTIGNHAGTSEGVEIGFNGVVLGIPGTPIIASWGDSNGFGATYTSAGYFGVENCSMSSTYLTIALSGTQQIDIGTNAGVTAINVVLPTATISSDRIAATLSLGANKALSDSQELGSLYIGGLAATTTGSFIVTAH